MHKGFPVAFVNEQRGLRSASPSTTRPPAIRSHTDISLALDSPRSSDFPKRSILDWVSITSKLDSRPPPVAHPSLDSPARSFTTHFFIGHDVDRSMSRGLNTIWQLQYVHIFRAAEHRFRQPLSTPFGTDTARPVDQADEFLRRAKDSHSFGRRHQGARFVGVSAVVYRLLPDCCVSTRNHRSLHTHPSPGSRQA